MPGEKGMETLTEKVKSERETGEFFWVEFCTARGKGKLREEGIWTFMRVQEGEFGDMR